MALLLSQYRESGSTMSGTNLVHDEFLDPNNLFVSLNVEVYSFSIVESVVLPCLELF